jgi:predicted nucleic acid-binding protein
MRVVLDAELLVSALLIQTGNPAAIDRARREGHFTLLTCREHPGQLLAGWPEPAIAQRIKPHEASGRENELKKLAARTDRLPRLRRPPDPGDDFLLGKQAKPII